jgi:hypothetical protein
MLSIICDSFSTVIKLIEQQQNDCGNIEHLKYLCLLDFYVESACQRKGYGKILLDTMISVCTTLTLFNLKFWLTCCQMEPTLKSAKDLCIDRPTENCLTLLRKYYNLEPTRVGIDNSFCIFSDLQHTHESSSPSPVDNQASYNLTA